MTIATVKKATNGKSVTPEMEVVKHESVVKENPILSLEKRIQKVQNLGIVIEKWKKLNDVKQNLSELQLGNDGLSSTITLKDVSGSEFKTSRNIVVSTVLESVQAVLDQKIVEVEAQINFE